VKKENPYVRDVSTDEQCRARRSFVHLCDNKDSMNKFLVKGNSGQTKCKCRHLRFVTAARVQFAGVLRTSTTKQNFVLTFLLFWSVDTTIWVDPTHDFEKNWTPSDSRQSGKHKFPDWILTRGNFFFVSPSYRRDSFHFFGLHEVVYCEVHTSNEEPNYDQTRLFSY
jgi:hypothetical protein